MSTALPPLLLGGFLVALLLPIRRPPAVRVAVEDGSLHVRLGLRDKLYCVRGDLALPLSDVEGVAVAPRHLVPATGLRLPGTSLPGVIRAGSYGTGASRDFWDVRRAEQLLVIQLRPGAHYRRVVLEVPQPAVTALELRAVVGSYTGLFT